MLKEITFNNDSTKQFLANNGITVLQYTVVNNPQPDQIFEDLPPFVMGDNMPMPQNNATVASAYQIAIPNYRVVFNIMADGDQKIPYDNHDPNMTTLNPANVDDSKATLAVRGNIYNGLELAYINRFNINLEGQTVSTYTWSNGDTKTITDDNGFGTAAMLYDNVPMTSVIGVDGNENLPNITYNTTGVKNVLFLPLQLGNRFDLAKCEELGIVHKFDYHIIAPGETVSTKTFSDAEFSLICCVSGEVTIGEYTVPEMNFYELDATQSVTVTAGATHSIIVQLIKVPTITLP